MKTIASRIFELGRGKIIILTISKGRKKKIDEGRKERKRKTYIDK